MTESRQTDPVHVADAPAQLLSFVTASWMTQAIYVATYLGIPDLLASGAKKSEELAAATNAHAPSLHRLLRALVTIDICIERDDGGFELAPLGSLLRTDAPGSLRSWTLYWGGQLWSTWSHLLDSVKTGESARKLVTGMDGFDRLKADPQSAALFNQAMREGTRLSAVGVVAAYDFSAMKRIVDVGGGYGELLAAILEANPALTGVLFDLPHAIDGAWSHLESHGVASRCEAVAGDFFEAVPGGADAWVLKSVLHDWNDERSQVILGNCARAMNGQGKLLIVERIMPQRLEVSAAHQLIARIDLTMLVALASQERTELQFRTLLAAAAFRVTRILPTSSGFSVIEAAPCFAQ
jgi:SAM-dependent methyltransferase